MARRIFISLTHGDHAIALALRKALDELFGEHLEISFSTSRDPGSSPRSGEDWFQWIVGQVTECEVAFILVTPSSVHKPWILWEAGAVAGAGLASGAAGLRKVRPLVFQVSTEFIPSPIRDSKLQFRRGDSAEDVESLFSEMLQDYQAELAPKRVINFGKSVNRVIDEYLTSIKAVLLNAPAVATPAVIEEWRLRLDGVLNQNRASEAEHLHDWMEIAFGRDGEKNPEPLDLRIHTRLAELYLRAKKPQRAIRQLELARQLAPRDIYLLRSLGKAYLDADDYEKAKTVVDRIVQLDKNALAHNAECAALAGRLARQAGDLPKAETLYAAALEHNVDSYYLANLLAEVRVDQGNLDGAREAFRRALAIIDRLNEDNAWTHATAAGAAFFIGDDEAALRHLRGVRHDDASNGVIDSIGRGLRGLADNVPNGSLRVEALLTALRQ
jgi:tetratricopeptide (TPR) repeat protein